MLKWLLSLTVLLCALGSSAFGLTVDDFNVGGFEQSLGINKQDFSFVQTGLDPNSVIGGRREAGIAINHPVDADDHAFYNVNWGNYPGCFAMTVAEDTELEYCDLSWGLENLNDGPASQALNADLLADGADRFRIYVNYSQNHNIGFYLYSGVNEDSRYGAGASIQLPNQKNYWIDLEFSQFPGIDFTDVDCISFYERIVSGPTSFGLDSIITIPEPCTMMLLGIGIPTLVYRKR